MHQRWIDNVFTVRMVIARSMTGDMSTFSMLPVCAQAEVIHRHQNASLRWLHPIAHIRQSAIDQSAHRIIEHRLLQLITNFNRDHPRSFYHHCLIVSFELSVASSQFLRSRHIQLRFQRVFFDVFSPGSNVITHKH